MKFIKQINLLDTATLAFQPFINLIHSPFSNLSAYASIHWLQLNELSPAQWGAFMHFYGPTRKLLKKDGLEIEDHDFFNIKSHNEKWNNLINLFQSEKLNSMEKLYFVRLLYYLGFYEQGIKISEKTISQCENLEDKIWAIFLKNLGNSIYQPFNWNPSEIEYFGLELKNSIILSFHVATLISKFYIRCKKNYEKGIIWLDRAEVLLHEYRSNFSDLAYARLLKYKADAELLIGKKDDAQKILFQALTKIDASMTNDESTMYLLKETKRRVLDALIFLNRENKNLKRALELSLEAVNLDPYCSYALIVAGTIAQEEKNIFANKFFQRSAFYGIIERPYAKWKLSEDTADLFFKNILIQESTESALNSITPKEIKLSIKIKQIEKIPDDQKNCFLKKIKLSPHYHSFLSFWELKDPPPCSPIFCNIPLVALEAVKKNTIPWFQTIYLQRAMPIKFREELFFAVSPNIEFSQSNLNVAISINAYQGNSEQMNWLSEKLKQITHMSIHQKTLFSRLLGSLGFYHEALQVLPKLDKSVHWSIEEEYAFCTELFFQNIVCAPTNNFPYDKLEFAFNKISQAPETLRMRLSLTILGSVFSGQRKNLFQLKLWRDRGFKILEFILENQNFDDFEKEILTSRFYRAVSFYPFLIQDHTTLLKEAEICEFYARNLKPENEKQRLLKKENLFPMLESMSRIYHRLGEKSHGLDLMKEIVDQIDPYDAKAWLQFADLNEKLGLLEQAKKAYQKACSFGVPLGGISWYRMGRLLEKMGDIESAQTCYWRSIKYCPKGISPLKRLKELSNDPYILLPLGS